jgi:prepilin-type N-terminal cleavage/methylation domain-containing protein
MRHRAIHCGFTLIEMLLALSLTAVLLTIVSVTIGGVLRDSQRLEAMRAEPFWLESVVQVIRRDLQQAEAYRETAGVLILHSHAGPPEAEGVFSHDTAQIEYEVVNRGDTRWLIRRVKPIQATHLKQSKVELLCGGVESMSLMACAPDEPPNTDRDRLEPLPGEAGKELGPIPDQLTLTLTHHVHEDTESETSAHGMQERRVESLERLLVIR